MKPDHTCDLVQDLLPLWLDHTLSQDSQALIQQHLPRCPACRRILADMDAPLTLPPEQDAAPLRKKRWYGWSWEAWPWAPASYC